MASSFFVALHGVHFQLPDGTVPFEGIDEVLSAETVGIIGRNGSAKSTFGKLASGAIAPSGGRIERAAHVHRVSQQSGRVAASTLAALAGLEQALSALRRLGRGEARPDDFDAIGEQWDLEARWLSAAAPAVRTTERWGTDAGRAAAGDAGPAARAHAVARRADQPP